MWTVNPGKFNKRIVFFRKGNEINDNGFYEEESEILIKETWASIRALKSQELTGSMTIHSLDTKIFRCRYFRSLEEYENGKKAYIKYKNTIYNIESINNLNEENKYFDIHAKVVDNSE